MASRAHADCPTATMGNKPESAIFYNTDGKLMEYCDGTNWIAMNVPGTGGAPSGCSNIGDVCSDGSVYAGLSPDGDIKMYTTPADAGQFTWNNGTANWIDTAMSNTSFATGEANTTLLVGLSDAASPYAAAVYCDGLSAHGKTDWYLPAKDELNVLYTKRAAIGGFDTSGSFPAGRYWSSSEGNNLYGWSQRFSDGSLSGQNKPTGLSVRCVRRAYCPTATMGPQPEGKLFFNADYRVLEVCAGNVWRPMGPVGDGSLANGLVAHLKLDETSGTTAADSAGAYDGTLKGGLDAGTDSVTGRIEGALALNGSSDYINLGNATGLNFTGATLTIAAWVNPDTTQIDDGAVTVLSKYDAIGGMRSYWFSVDSSTGQLRWFISPDGNTDWVNNAKLSAGTIPFGSWHHVAVTVSGSNVNFYIDGALDSSATTNASTIESNSARVYIGGIVSSTTIPDGLLAGAIDDVRVYDRTLSAQEIADLYAETGCTNPSRPAGTLFYNSDAHVMQYCDGANWVSIGKAPPDPCAGSPLPGDVCADGSVYAGLSPDGNVKMYTTPADAGQFTWNNGTANWIDTAMANNSYTTGEANTTLLVGLSDAASPYEAAVYCGGLSAHGKSDWYLPAQDELDVLYDNRTVIGGFNTSGFVPAGYYWSSSENASTQAIGQSFSVGVQGSSSKDGGLSVRCVRKD